jgi:signal transduction histidine kinase
MRPAIRHEIYRIGREALVNAFCHSRAKRVEFEIEYADSDLRMRVRDNGCGIDPQVLAAGREGHWGLPGMRERAGFRNQLTVKHSSRSRPRKLSGARSPRPV